MRIGNRLDEENFSEVAELNSDGEYHESNSPLTKNFTKNDCDHLSLHVHQLLTNTIELDEQPVWKYLRIGVKFLALVLGVVSGVPWLYSGKLTAEKLSFLPLQYIIGAGLILSYGATSAWALLSITDDILKAKSPLVKKMEVKASVLHGAPRHVMCHFFGLLTIIPAIYITIKYNSDATRIEFAVLSSIISYIFETLGFYKLSDYLFNFYSELSGKKILKEKDKFAYDIDSKLIPFIEEDINRMDRLSISDADPQTTLRNFFELLDESRVAYKPPYINRGLDAVLKVFWIASVPNIMLIFRVMITSKATFKVNESIFLNVLATGLVNLPLYGLVFFSMLTLSNLMSSKISSVLGQNEKTGGHIYQSYFCISMIMNILAFSLSAASAASNAYVTYEEMNKTLFSPAVWLFTVCSFWNSTIFQTIGCVDLLDRFYRFIDSFKDKKHAQFYRLWSKLPDLSQTIKGVDDEVFDIFHSKQGLLT